MSSYLVKPGKAKIGPKAPVRRRETDAEAGPSQTRRESTARASVAPFEEIGRRQSVVHTTETSDLVPQPVSSGRLREAPPSPRQPASDDEDAILIPEDPYPRDRATKRRRIDTENAPTPQKTTESSRQLTLAPLNPVHDAAKSVEPPLNSSAAVDLGNEPAQKAQKTKAARSERKPRKPRRKKEALPEDAEEHQVEPGETRMEDLTRDSGLGRRSTREKRLVERDEQEREAKRAAARGELATIISTRDEDEDSEEDGKSSTNDNDTTSQPGDSQAGPSNALVTVPEQTPAPSTSFKNRFAPQVRIVNGAIELNEASRFVDRHDLAQADADSRETRVEDELTRRVNQGNYMKRETRTKWSDEETALFYEGLRMFGTDFDLLKTLFPGRNRRQIKLKFTKEEKNDEEYIKHVLLYEKKAPSLDLIEELAGVKFTDLKNPEDYTQLLEQDKAELEKLAAAAAATA